MNVEASGTPRTRKQAAVRKREIVISAIQIIGEKGSASLTIQAVGERCGITNSGVMHHFTSKDDILVEVLREGERRDEDALQFLRELAFPALQDEATRRDMIRTSMRAIVERNAGQPEMLKLVTVLRAEAMSPDHPAHHHFQSRMQAVLAIFAEMFQPICPDPRSEARQFLALMQGLESQWIAEGMAFDLVEEWDCAAARLLPAQAGHGCDTPAVQIPPMA